MRTITKAILLLLFSTVIAGRVSAQRLDGTLRVTVADASEASVLEAKVTVTNDNTNVPLSTSTSSAGTYVFPNLLVGTYTVAVEKLGFKTTVQKAVRVDSNQVADLKVNLEVGEASAVVQVEASTDLVKLTNSELSATLEGHITNTLPVNTLGGDVKEFAVFIPGTTTQPAGISGGSGGSIGGTRPRFNGFSIDGVDDNRLDVNGPIQPVIQESVAELTVLTNQFSVEYGHSAGGQFNTVTKSGGNEWHGAGWEFNRNRNYDAFDNQQKERGAKDRFDYNRAGASAGGPIRKGRLFAYGAYESINDGSAASGTTVIMPTANGFNQLRTLNPDGAVSDLTCAVPDSTDC